MTAVELTALKAALAVQRERRLLVIAGPAAWGRSSAGDVIASWGGQWCWVGQEAPAAVVDLPHDRPGAALGREWDGAVIDTWTGLRPDLLGALGGAVRGGGLLVLVTPAIAEWDSWRDPDYDRIATYPRQRADLGCRFWQRLRRMLDDPAVVVWQASGGPTLAFPPQITGSAVDSSVPPDEGAAIAAQLAVVDAIERCGRGRARRPLVITADRGRGKSAALGIAAARLLAAGREVVVTGPRVESCETLFKHARHPWAAEGTSQPASQTPRFVPVDELVQRARRGRIDPTVVLLVDEAAGLATDVLAYLLSYPRVVFASTVHGYEGAGRGFELRFLPLLGRVTPHWRRTTLTAPLRWSPTDPLERWLYRTLLLDARPAVPAERSSLSASNPCTIRRLSQAELDDEALLANLFGLLVQAHYRTSPDDLRQLLDDPGLQLWVALDGSAVVGALIVVEEGALPTELHAAIVAGRRRLRGHLLPQSLAVHTGVAPLLAQRWWRVQRIAVASDQQRQGIGRRLLAALDAAAKAAEIDSLGVSFAASAAVLRFWRGVGFVPLRIGVQREVGSGGEALMLGRGISLPGQVLATKLATQLWRQLPVVLADYLRHWEPQLVVALFGAFAASAEAVLSAETADRPTPEESAQARRFADGTLGLESCLDAVARVARWAFTQEVQLAPAAVTLVVSRIVQLRGWSETAALAGATGRPQAERELRNAVDELLGVLECSSLPLLKEPFRQ